MRIAAIPLAVLALLLAMPAADNEGSSAADRGPQASSEPEVAARSVS